MKFLDRIADALIARAMRTPYTHITDADGRPYMDRYWLLRIGKRGGGESGDYPLFGIRIHHIRSSDDDRHFHDHPWPFLTIILRGGYFEIRPGLSTAYAAQGKGERTWHRAGSILFRRARDWHRVQLSATEPSGGKPFEISAWTLFITGPFRHTWGFLLPIGKVPHRDYFALMNRNTTVRKEAA